MTQQTCNLGTSDLPGGSFLNGVSWALFQPKIASESNFISSELCSQLAATASVASMSNLVLNLL